MIGVGVATTSSVPGPSLADGTAPLVNNLFRIDPNITADVGGIFQKKKKSIAAFFGKKK